MAHSALHFALGMAVAGAAALPALARAWRAGERLAGRLRAWLLSSCALGLWAVAPNLLRRAGCSANLCRGPWMNVFLFHPLLDRLYDGGSIVGPSLLALLFAAQYAALVAAAARAERRA
ncbi:MAG: hypothetical protein FJ225_02625 [Lentisphaerae bacterium]|nr:hypothetical protein [Lentisphaerota bacterium]